MVFWRIWQPKHRLNEVAQGNFIKDQLTSIFNTFTQLTIGGQGSHSIASLTTMATETPTQETWEQQEMLRQQTMMIKIKHITKAIKNNFQLINTQVWGTMRNFHMLITRMFIT